MFQTKFTEAVVSYDSGEESDDSMSCFSQASLNNLIESFTDASYLTLGIGYALMVLLSKFIRLTPCPSV